MSTCICLEVTNYGTLAVMWKLSISWAENHAKRWRAGTPRAGGRFKGDACMPLSPSGRCVL